MKFKKRCDEKNVSQKFCSKQILAYDKTKSAPEYRQSDWSLPSTDASLYDRVVRNRTLQGVSIKKACPLQFIDALI